MRRYQPFSLVSFLHTFILPTVLAFFPQPTHLHAIGIREEFRRVSDETGETPVAGTGVSEPAKQIAGAEFPVHASQADNHSVQNAEPGELRGKSLVVQHHHRFGKCALSATYGTDRKRPKCDLSAGVQHGQRGVRDEREQVERTVERGEQLQGPVADQLSGRETARSECYIYIYTGKTARYSLRVFQRISVVRRFIWSARTERRPVTYSVPNTRS